MDKENIAKIKLQMKLNGKKPACENCRYWKHFPTHPGTNIKCEFGIRVIPYRIHKNKFRYDVKPTGVFRRLYAFCEKFEFEK